MSGGEWKYLTANKWGKQICEKLGVDWKRVSRIVIDLSPQSLALLYVTFLGTEDLLDIELPDPTEVKIMMGKQPDGEVKYEADAECLTNA